MRRTCLPLVLVLAAACSGPADDAGDFGWVVEVTSDVPLDRVELLYGVVFGADVVGPITPARRARGELADELAPLIESNVVDTDLDAETTGRLTFNHPLRPSVVAIGYRRDAGGVLRPAAAATVATVSAPSTLTMRLTAAALAGVEVWGEARTCARVAAGPVYFIAYDDHDCDGMPPARDCDDGNHCAVDAPTPAERAGCQTSMCQPCVDRTPDACALGTRAVCTDAPGGIPAYGCDADPACGPATCMPESSCRLQCGLDWPETDPRACLAAAWGSGLAGADAIPCDLPAARHPDDPNGAILCAGGSTVEAALPFTDCRDPRVAIGETVTTTTAAVIVPPCTVRLTVTATADLQLVARGVLVTFTAAEGSASARLQLAAVPDTCGGIGACAAAPATSVCTR